MGGGGTWLKNINAALRRGLPDKGVMHDLPLSILDLRKASDHSVLTGASTPTIQTAGNVPFVRWAATDVTPVNLPGYIPRELAMASANTTRSGGPTLRVKGLVRSGGSTDAITLAAALYLRASGWAGGVTPIGTLKGVLNSAAVWAATKNLTLPEVATWDFTLQLNGDAPAKYIEPGDTFILQLTPGAHGTDTLELHSLWIEWAANSSFTDQTLRAVLDN